MQITTHTPAITFPLWDCTDDIMVRLEVNDDPGLAFPLVRLTFEDGANKLSEDMPPESARFLAERLIEYADHAEKGDD